jgi:hypothetical protein
MKESCFNCLYFIDGMFCKLLGCTFNYPDCYSCGDYVPTNWRKCCKWCIYCGWIKSDDETKRLFNLGKDRNAYKGCLLTKDEIIDQEARTACTKFTLPHERKGNEL